MAKKTKTLLAAAMAFAASPQGRQLLAQAKEYASRPETKQRAQQLIAQARTRGKGYTPSTPVRVNGSNSPSYDTPPQN